MDNIKARDLFENTFTKIKTVLEFNKEWSDGQGGFGPAVSHSDFQRLYPGEIVKSETPGQRRMIIVGTTYGPAIIYERYMPRDKRGQDYYCDASTTLHAFFNDHFDEGALTSKLNSINLMALIGYHNPQNENIGKTIEYVNRHLNVI